MATQNSSNDAPFILPDDWRGKVITKIREIIKKADPEITEEVKYRTATNPNGVLVWYKNGMLLTGEVYKLHLRLALSKGHLLKDKDPKSLINTHRAVILKEEDKLDEDAFKNLILAAVEFNLNKKK